MMPEDQLLEMSRDLMSIPGIEEVRDSSTHLARDTIREAYDFCRICYSYNELDFPGKKMPLVIQDTTKGVVVTALESCRPYYLLRFGNLVEPGNEQFKPVLDQLLTEVNDQG